MKIILSLLAFTFYFSAFANETIVMDPNNLLEKVDLFLPTQKLEEIFACTTKAQFFSPVKSAQLGCGEDGCGAVFQTDSSAESEWLVGNCQNQSVSIYANDGAIWDISNIVLQKYKNPARIFLANLSSYIGYEGHLKIISVESANYTLASGKVLPSLNVNFEFYLKGEVRGIQSLISVVKDAPGVAQVARFRVMSTTWFRLKEF